MKKYIKFLVIILIAVLSTISFPKSVSAEEDLIVTDWVVDTYLLENGDLQISEDITYEFNEKYNGVYRDISASENSSIQSIKLGEVLENELTDYTQVEKAKKGDEGVFTTESDNNKVRIMIYSPSKDEFKTFRISYVIKNVATRYNDTGELYYKYLDDDNKTAINKFVININLPVEDNSDKVKVFGHGPSNGNIHKINNSSYQLTVTDVPSKTFVKARVLFPPEFIAKSNNNYKVDKYQEIIDEETAFWEGIEQDKQRKEDIKKLLDKITLFACCISALVFAIVLYKCRRRINPDILKIEYKKIPEDCTPAVASYISGISVGTNIIFATILDLFRKGYLSICPDEESSYSSRNKDYLIYKTKSVDMFLLGHERYFMHWLFDKIGDGEAVSTKDIAYYNKHDAQEFYNSEKAWKSKIKSEANRKRYLDQSKKPQGVALVVISLIDIILSVIVALAGSIYALFGFVLGVILLIFGMSLFSRLSDKGYEQYKKWMSFKKYMKKKNPDLSQEDAIDSLDSSLIYALGLDVVNNHTFTQDLIEDYSCDSWIFWYIAFSGSADNSFSNSINKSFSINESSLSSSDSSFSSGGDGGIGGGGTGGF